MGVEFIRFMTRRGMRWLINEIFGFNNDSKRINIETKISGRGRMAKIRSQSSGMDNSKLVVDVEKIGMTGW